MAKHTPAFFKTVETGVRNKMKARFKDTRCTLSIGMIVKNEEKHLRNCLEALKPLREAVSNELIIVDTGSEDSTVEIAEEYTDKVFSFEWINDFAAARNYGLDKATGKWFMYLDADEYLSSPDELIEFLNSEKENKKYNTASVVIHSYLDQQKLRCSDFTATRLFRMNTGNRFEGAIHEVPFRIPPFKDLLQTRFDHYGYVYENEEEREKKYDRNNKLLEAELEKTPDDIRLICLYSTSCPPEKRIELLEHGRELVKTQPEHYYFPEVYWRLSREYYRTEQFEKIVELSDEYKSLSTQDHVGEVELSYNLGYAYYKMDQYEKMLETYDRYLELYERYHDGSLIREDSACTVCERGNLFIYNLVLAQMGSALELLGRGEEAFDKLFKINFLEMEDNSKNFVQALFFRLANLSGKPSMLAEAEDWIRNSGLPDKTKLNYCRSIANIYLQKGFEIEEEIPEKESVFSRLLRLEKTAGKKEWETILERLAGNPEEAELYGAVALLHALRQQRDPSVLLKSAAAEDIQKWNIRISELSKGMDNYLIEYGRPEELGNDLSFSFWFIDLESRLADKCSEENRLFLSQRIIEDFAWYAGRLYSKEMLTPENIHILPSSYRFAYWCSRALETKSQGDMVGYIKFLGEASHACPAMAEIIKPLVKDVRENDEALKAQREKQELAKKVKGIIEGMILDNRFEDAQSVLAQYELIAPDDPDIHSLKAAMLQPVFSEI